MRELKRCVKKISKDVIPHSPDWNRRQIHCKVKANYREKFTVPIAGSLKATVVGSSYHWPIGDGTTTVVFFMRTVAFSPFQLFLR